MGERAKTLCGSTCGLPGSYVPAWWMPTDGADQ